jgi:hypothetical protein
MEVLLSTPLHSDNEATVTAFFKYTFCEPIIGVDWTSNSKFHVILWLFLKFSFWIRD